MKDIKFCLVVLTSLLFNNKYLLAQQGQGCLYKYNSGDTRIFTNPLGTNKTYNDAPGPIAANPNGNTSAPAYYGSQVSGGAFYTYRSNDCVDPSPSTRSTQSSNCVIWDGDSAMYPGYLVNYVVNCDLDDHVLMMFVLLGVPAAYSLVKRRNSC